MNKRNPYIYGSSGCVISDCEACAGTGYIQDGDCFGDPCPVCRPKGRNLITHTDERIRKLLNKGLSCGQVGRKIGRPDGRARVHKVGCQCNHVPEAMTDGWGYCFCCGKLLNEEIWEGR